MSGRQYASRASDQGGFLLLPVVVALVLIASIALLLNQESAVNTGLSGRDAEVDRLRQVTEAGWQHANWKTQNKDCTGYGAISSTSFGDHSYSAIVTPSAGSPVTIAATGTLANGNGRTLTRSNVKGFETGPQTVVLQPGGAGKDSFIESETGHTGHNKGDLDELNTSSQTGKEYRALMQFDLSSVPSNAKIVAATLDLELQSLGETAAVEAHQLTRDWTEAGVTWDAYDGTNPWTTPGGDFVSAVSGSFLADSVGIKSMDLTALTQAWVDGSQSNFGVILLSPSGAGPENKYHSSDKIGEEHPKLTIDYVCECGVICVAASALPIILSTEDNATLGGLSFSDKDLAEYDPLTATATLYLDGAAVGITQDIDAVHVLANDRIVLSTIDTTTLGGITFEKEDLVEYDPVDDIATLRFDGSNLLSGGQTDISAVHVLDDGTLLLTNENSVSLGGLSFEPNDIVLYDPVADAAAMYLDGDALGLVGWIDAVHLLENNHLVLSTATNATLGGLSLPSPISAQSMDQSRLPSWSERFGLELVTTSREGVTSLLNHVVGRHGDDANMSGLVEGLDLAGRLVTVANRQVDVHQDDIGKLTTGDLDGAAAVFCLQHIVSLAAQSSNQETAMALVIFYDEDFLHLPDRICF